MLRYVNDAYFQQIFIRRNDTNDLVNLCYRVVVVTVSYAQDTRTSSS